MRHDFRLDFDFRSSSTWDTDPNSQTNEPGEQVNRLHGDPRLSLSGHERNKLFMNQAGDNFADISGISGVDSVKDSRSFVTWDFDRDGWQDIALSNVNGPILNLYRNQMGSFEGAQENQMIAVRLVGGNKTSAASNEFSSRDGFGARIRVKVGDQWQTRELRCGEGLAAQNSNNLLFGLGTAAQADSIEVIWPSGKTQTLPATPANAFVTIYEDVQETADGSGFVKVDYRRSVDMTQLTELQPAPKEMSISAGGTAAELVLYTSMATWCASCKEHLPELSRIREIFPAEVIEMKGVPVDLEDTESMLDQYVSTFTPPYEMLSKLPEDQRTHYTELVEGTLNRESLPSSVITDGQGNVLQVFAGVPTVSDIKRLLK